MDVTRVRRGAQNGVDRYGNPVYAPTAETVLPGAMFAPGGTSEPVEAGRSAVITLPTVFFPRTWPDIEPTDQVRVFAELYEVVGDPAEWRSPWGTNLGGLVVQLNRVEG